MEEKELEEMYRREYLEPVHSIGRITCLLAVVGMFLPSIWLYLQYGIFPPGEAIGLGMILALTYAVPFFIIEPISYYPILGDAGTYMSFLAGNISNMRLPCAAVAEAVTGVEEGTIQAELVATIGIAVSIWMSTWAVFIGAIGTGWIVATFPPWVKDAFSSYLLPAVFGAVFGQFALRGPKYAPVALALSIVMILLALPAYVIIPVAVFGTIGLGRLIYQHTEKERRP
ncbi:MAG: hypothetical protein ACTSXC_05815 [Candidatus Freyarchaeota archaeon]